MLPATEGRAQGCVADIRGVAGQSPRHRLREIVAPADPGRLMDDGAACSRDTSLHSGWRSFRIRDHAVRAGVLAPIIRWSVLGGLADPRGDGAMWSGRGTNLFALGGMSANLSAVHVLIAPALSWNENRRFDFSPSADPTRSGFASPWYAGAWSLDLPTRMGADPFATLSPGQSALWISRWNFDAGISASTQAWGPGVRAHLVLGPDAPGVPRVFFRTARPLHSVAGGLSLAGFAGVLVESRFFDDASPNDRRTLLAWTAALAPRWAPGVVIGLSHATMLSRISTAPAAEQLLSLSAEYSAPLDAFRLWLEFGRNEGLPSLSRFLHAPHDRLAYVLGMESALARTQRGSLLFTAEAANLEQQAGVRGEAARDFYTSADIQQGWTNRGRILGVPTGPGSQSQWLALDWVARRWSAGLFAERVRWNEDAFFRLGSPFAIRHDVTVQTGLSLGAVAMGYEITARVSTGKRLNYLFQNGSYTPGFRTVDITVPQIRMSLSPIHR